MFFAAYGADSSTVPTDKEITKEVDASQVGEEAFCTIFDSLYLVLGMGGSSYENKLSALIDGRQESSENNVNRLLGVFAFGVGKAFSENFYIGAEMLCDFSKTKSRHMKLGNSDVETKVSPVIPSLGVRFGYLNRDWEMLFYTKIAASRASTSFKNNDYDRKIVKIAPAVAIGVEKAFSKKFSARLECEYRFSSNGGTGSIQIPKAKAKSARGINVRALIAYHVNAGLQ
ncbi:hypothetical protein FACS189449_03590 [Alphaproteobacteria bacterium]|nr:hypothetical protein FACS189449_03590 [Alphaproteobacteria bacterium]